MTHIRVKEDLSKIHPLCGSGSTLGGFAIITGNIFYSARHSGQQVLCDTEREQMLNVQETLPYTPVSSSPILVSNEH